MLSAVINACDQRMCVYVCMHWMLVIEGGGFGVGKMGLVLALGIGMDMAQK